MWVDGRKYFPYVAFVGQSDKMMLILGNRRFESTDEKKQTAGSGMRRKSRRIT
jgi:hypothetical protein